MPIKVKIDKDLMRSRMLKELRALGTDGLQKMPERDKIQGGLETIAEMKQYIARGISPIAGRGRFPAYKAASAYSKIKKLSRGLTGTRRTRARAKAAKAKQGYPYSVMGKYPGKQVRPVNLRLSGMFLDRWLEVRATAKGFAIGFWNQKAQKMEQGHREGANTQPERPIIPVTGESFIIQITRVMESAITDSLIKWLERYARSRK